MIPEFIAKIYQNQADVLGWTWVPDDHIVDDNFEPVPAIPDFAPKQDYAVLRVAEMYLQQTRRLWREYYPVVHAFVSYGDPAAPRTVSTIAGPGQLKELGTENLDRLIGLAYRIAGPVVYDGQDIEFLAGLYAVPAKDGAKLLLDTLGQLSSLAPAMKQAIDLANIFKGGIEGLLGLGGTRLALGIHDALRISGARRARPGFLVAFNAPASSIDPKTLWIRGGRLCQGPNPIAATEFRIADAMLIELHKGSSRAPSWATLPQLASFVEKFDNTLRDAPEADLANRINSLFRQFEATLSRAEDLTEPDKGTIRAESASQLQERVKKIRDGGLIEEKSLGGGTISINPRTFRPSEFSDMTPVSMRANRAEGTPVIDGR
jgi:hypothetical protein